MAVMIFIKDKKKMVIVIFFQVALFSLILLIYKTRYVFQFSFQIHDEVLTILNQI
jgi:TRAP-type C4-dicarboxylate transport system permease small subunit